MKREPAWRVFAGEFNDATIELKGTGAKTPSYVVTPLGAKINRLFIVGVLTDVEPTSEGGDMLRAHLSDPTGVYTMYAGQFQQEATDALAAIDPPAFVAVVAKARTYKPEEDGSLFVSIRPEEIHEVDIETRDRWILETCKHTRERTEAVIEALKMKEPNDADLTKLGYSRWLSEGVTTAVKGYESINVKKYVALIRESLEYLSPNREKQMQIQPKKEQKKTKKVVETPQEDQDIAKEQETTDESEEAEEIETTVLETIKELEGKDGAAWDAIIKRCEKKKLDTDAIEEALTSLMDKGFIFEPVLGTIKTT